jgi:hypothetical protein
MCVCGGEVSGWVQRLYCPYAFMPSCWYSWCVCVTGWPCTCQGIQLLPLKESFLGIASAVLGFGCLMMHDKSLGSLYHATQASCMGLPIKGPMFDRACLWMRCGYPGILSGLVRWPGQEFHSGLCNCAFMQVGFWRPTFGWATWTSVFFRLVTCDAVVRLNSTDNEPFDLKRMKWMGQFENQ